MIEPGEYEIHFGCVGQPKTQIFNFNLPSEAAMDIIISGEDVSVTAATVTTIT